MQNIESQQKPSDDAHRKCLRITRKACSTAAEKEIYIHIKRIQNNIMTKNNPAPANNPCLSDNFVFKLPQLKKRFIAACSELISFRVSFKCVHF